jgi:hypothetical protein
MPAEQTDGFADNWSYLRTELHWLERLLLAAVAKQRKEAKDIDRIAQSKADRATSHWWKGIITADGEIAYDEYRQPAGIKVNYHSQIEAQVQASHQRGILLALPALKERLGLNLFEKNLVLMSLASEVNRRYARLYRYLQGEDNLNNSDLPTLDLVLRLLCKNDQEWRSARNHLLGDSRLIRYKLLNLLPASENTLLNSSLKLTMPLVNYLLAEQPTLQALEQLLPVLANETPLVRKVSRPAPVWLQRTQNQKQWADLILPEFNLETLQQLSQRLQGYIKALDQWNLDSEEITQPGVIALVAGASGTGKTLAAQILATQLQTALYLVDLATLDAANYSALLEEIAAIAPIVLLIKSAELWLKRSSQLPAVLLHQFWTKRRHVPALTLFSVRQPAAVQVNWQRQFDQQINFPLPDIDCRLLLWQQAFPVQVPLEPTINWQGLATALPLSGGEIQHLAQIAITIAANAGAEVRLSHVLQALAQRGKVVEIQPLPAAKKRGRKKTG